MCVNFCFHWLRWMNVYCHWLQDESEMHHMIWRSITAVNLGNYTRVTCALKGPLCRAAQLFWPTTSVLFGSLTDCNLVLKLPQIHLECLTLYQYPLKNEIAPTVNPALQLATSPQLRQVIKGAEQQFLQTPDHSQPTRVSRNVISSEYSHGRRK